MVLAKTNESDDLPTIDNACEDDDYSGDCSDDGLRIVIESPQQSKRKNKVLSIAPDEKEIIESVEQEIEKTLEEKAAKTNLTASNVKNILKHVVTNEHVLAMVRQAEDPDGPKEELPLYEPKLTRAKAKELFSSQTVAPIPWLPPPKPPPEVQVLISEELPEDSSDDEYVPVEEESEDDREGSVFSENDPPSLDPATPKNADSSTQTNWSEDGVFKVPHVKTREEAIEEANIARRTRSKLCLSSTPLEVIEGAFIPPDITTDMYDMDCDDDEWRDFLKKFTRPLDEVIRHAEDEDHDPEYNVLADEEIDKVDKEELREDKGVKITRKELNALIAELFDYADSFTTDNQVKEIDPQPQYTVLETQNEEQTRDASSPAKNAEQEEEIAPQIFVEVEPPMMEATQMLLLEQQMRQHVQLLTQNFLLLYEHPEYNELADVCREYLYNLRFLPGDREKSYFLASNLPSAMKLIERWQDKFNSDDDDDDEAKNTRKFVARVIAESKQSRSAGIEYVPTFPPLILETVSKSDVFLYPWLLPRIPFKSASLFATSEFISSEDELIALGLEQFTTFLEGDSYHVNHKGDVRLSHVCHYIQRYVMPVKDVTRIYKHVSERRQLRNTMNPIKYYFENRRAPATLHYVVALEQLEVVPPCRRKIDQLPYQWKQFIHPNEQNVTTFVAIPIYPANITKVVKPPVYNRNFSSNKRRLAPNAATQQKNSSAFKPRCPAKSSGRRTERLRSSTDSEVSFNKFFRGSKFASTPKCKPGKLEYYFGTAQKKRGTCCGEAASLRQFKFNSSIFEKLRGSQTDVKPSAMLPSMPSLNTPGKKSPERYNSGVEADEEVDKLLNKRTEVESVESKTEISMSVEKDNLDDINALMIASSTVTARATTTTTKRRLSGAEKKKAKLRKEYNANKLMLSPEDPSVTKEKTNMYVQAFYDKLQERLDMHEYHRLLGILNEFNENEGSVSDLYHDVNKILHPKYPDLTDEFLMFLTSAQAKTVGKLVPHLMLSNMSLFLRKLEMYFKEQPAQVRKIYRSLTDLANCFDVTMDKVKSTILPLLKGNSLLTDWFLQIFPCEKPPKSLLDGPWEAIEIGKENAAVTSNDIYETIVVPEVEDPYGGPNCICSCHNVDDQTFKSRLRHCIPCGTKFLQGRVYIQTGKGLRLAKVTFNSNSGIDHYARLNCRASAPQQKRKMDVHLIKQVSPNKDSQDEVRMSNESEDDAELSKRKHQKSVKKPRQRKPRKTEKSSKNTKEKTTARATNSNTIENCDVNKSFKNDNKETATTTESALKKEPEPLPSCSGLQQQKPANEEVMEWDCNTSIESLELELHLSPSVGSESEENSQDKRNSDSDDALEDLKSPPLLLSHSENSNSNASEEISWTRDEDKIILETLQREGNREETFTHISQLLENRSIVKIKARFQTLMSLLQAMAAESVS